MNGPHPTQEAGRDQASETTGGGVQVHYFARTDVGQIREHNEDNFLVADLSSRARGMTEGFFSPIGLHGSLFAVCDGMGGAAAGEIASQLAVDIVYERMVEGLRDGQRVVRDDLARRLVRAVESAGQRIFHEAKMDRTRRGMGTTVTAAALLDDYLFLAQVGDSRGYILRGGELVQVTRDQSLVNQLIEAGQLTEEEAETFEHNNIILQALGTSDTVQVDLTFARLRKGDLLMLCSDGLSGMVRFDEIREILRTSPDPMAACKTLIDRANAAGGHDNVTVIVCRFDGTGLSTGEPEPLRYRKYSLPEEISQDSTEPQRRPALGAGPMLQSPAQAFTSPTNPGAVAPVANHTPTVPMQTPPEAVLGAGHVPRPRAEEEHIEIPGTHIPAWVVIVLGTVVFAVVGGFAFLLLR